MVGKNLNYGNHFWRRYRHYRGLWHIMVNNEAHLKIIDHICLPVLSVLALLIVSFSREKRGAVIHYGILPRYLRGFCRLFKIQTGTIVSVLSACFCLKIREIKYGDDISDLPHLHLSIMEKVTTITGELLAEIQADPGVRGLAALIGEKPALAYTAKYLAGQELFPQILPLVACYANLKPPGNYLVVWGQQWPLSWQRLIQRHLEWISFDFFQWPLWLLLMRRVLAKINFVLKLPAITIASILEHGIVLKTIPKKSFKMITEFIDPGRLNGTAYDADYWIDGEKVRKDEVLFFLTKNQKKFLNGAGYTVENIFKLFNDKNYQLVQLEKLSFPYTLLKSLFFHYLTLLNIILSNNHLSCYVVAKAWSDYLAYAPLFQHYFSKNLIYLTFPNGHTGVRSDEAILTGLCRKHGLRSVGCQTRTIYAKKFEDFFDCYDLYFSWGPAWHEMLPGRMDFVEKIIEVGCIYLDYLIPYSKKYFKANPYKDHKRKITVSIFPSDISYNHHHTKKYVTSFLTNCARLAQAYPDVDFLVKNKDPENIEIIMADNEFRQLYSSVRDNFTFISRLRHDYAEVMAKADLIIAIAFTTPGIEGLLMGKPSIYFSDLKCGGQAFASIPDLVAHNFNELEKLFTKIVIDGELNPYVFSSNVKMVDPFTDGQALTRINDILVGQ